MQLDPSELSKGAMYAWMVNLITPRPIAWVSTQSSSGVRNLAPFSFFNGVGANPPTLMFCPANQRDGRPKDTLANVRETGQFVVNLVTSDVVDAMNLTAGEYEADQDEFKIASVATADSSKVDVPRVAGAAASIECELLQAIQLGSGPAGANLVVGRIVWIDVRDDLVVDGRLDATKLETIGRMGGATYVLTTDRFEMPRPKA